MDYLFEFIFNLLFDGSVEIIKNKRVSKWIRYPLVILISLFIISIILFVLISGIYILIRNSNKLDILIGLFLVIIAVVFIVLLFFKIKE